MSTTYKKKRMTGSTAWKIIIFFVLGFSVFIGGIAGLGTFIIGEEGIYTSTRKEFVQQAMAGRARSDLEIFLEWYLSGEIYYIDKIENLCEQNGVEAEVIIENVGVVKQFGGTEHLQWNTPYVYEMSFYLEKDEYTQLIKEYETQYEEVPNETEEETSESGVIFLPEPKIGIMKLYINPYPVGDYSILYQYAQEFYNYRFTIPIIFVTGLILAIISFIFLMCAAGRKNGQEGIVPSVLTCIYLDILTCIFIVIELAVIVLIDIIVNNFDSTIIAFIGLIIGTVLTVIWTTIYCMEFTLRLKRGNWWKHTFIYKVLHFIKKIFGFIGKTMLYCIKGIPFVLTTVIVFLGICILEFWGIIAFGELELFVLWFLEKMILFVAVLYVALMCKKLQEGSERLAKGNLSAKVDTSKMILDFKEHGENLNHIGEGIAKAVDERMKSEHLKTELITNVSHDLKTPLTSIINYADLIGNESLENERVTEYAEVLLRQSKRLKRLLENLVEASKATTGNLEVNPAPCEVGVLLTQAVGEYEQRLAEKQLEVIARQPEESMCIMADGRHMWRVFDNLLNNIYKYAQENSRVYLSVEPKDNNVCIIFRNMSKYPLDISAEELEERFVRGDKSRHLEGNGLGLSIARSLVDLQNGSMEIVTDGDLFKVILCFKKINNIIENNIPDTKEKIVFNEEQTESF